MKILGGEGANRLHRVLRSRARPDLRRVGRVPGAPAGRRFRRGHRHAIRATAEALRLIVEEITKLQRERVSIRELADAQAYLAGSFPLTIETPDAIAAQVLNALFYGLPLSDIENYRELVNEITPDDIQRVARQYLQARSAVGRPRRQRRSAFAKDLAGVGFPTVRTGQLARARSDVRRPCTGGRARRRPRGARIAREPRVAQRSSTHAHRHGVLRRGVRRPVRRRARDGAAASRAGHARLRLRRRAAGRAGAELIGDYRGLAVTGLTEALRVLPRSFAMLRRLRRADW